MDMGSICKFCTENQSKYVCPKCTAPYCSLLCYKSSSHLECSEMFYKDCIEEELDIQGSDNASKKEMIDILKRVYGENEESESDSDDDDLTNLNERLNGIDLDNSEEVWNLLTDSEKAEFEHLVKSGDITKILPEYTPWWCLPIEKQLVTEVGENIKDNELPSLLTNIPNLSILSKKSPSEFIQWNLVNIITPYVFLIRYYNGKHKSYLSEFINGLYSLSSNLSVNQNFDSYDTALKSVELSIQEHDMFKGFIGFSLINDDLETIFSNGLDSNCNYNIKLVLSDMHNLMNKYKNEKKKFVSKKTEQGEFNRKFPDPEASYFTHVDVKKIRLLLKKIEYYFSWVNENKFNLI
ncbi:Zinc finger, HIT-type [Cinara cedri]|uniref:Zinc finger, HIT-type n=1 Tax=Cinara cedri TaxID=506608 RepID=A0A5E4NEW3_9HEMI|nr:Zinc finger, HIT-type [Cinara cedri]